jgi:hypothetical protein
MADIHTKEQRSFNNLSAVADVSNKGQGYKAGDAGAALFTCQWVSFINCMIKLQTKQTGIVYISL